VERRARFLRGAFGAADVVVSPSVFYRETFTRAGMPAERIVVCRFGVDAPGRAAGVRPGAPRPLRVGYLGQVAWHKGVHVLLGAVRRLGAAPLRVTVHGDPSRVPAYTAALRRLAQGDDRVTIGPAFARDELARVLAGLDVVAVPSLWPEAGPLVAYEALAHGVPVVAAALGSIPEVVRDGSNGLLVAPGDPGPLAEALRRLADDPDLLARLRAGAGYGRRVDDEVDDHEALYRRVTAGEPAARGRP
jgi:glycosyltransferase involved in cell wall biosynthesis